MNVISPKPNVKNEKKIETAKKMQNVKFVLPFIFTLNLLKCTFFEKKTSEEKFHIDSR